MILSPLTILLLHATQEMENAKTEILQDSRSTLGEGIEEPDTISLLDTVQDFIAASWAQGNRYAQTCC